MLEVLALLLVIQSQPYQRTVALTTSNRIVATINSHITTLTDYFSLQQQNNILSEENAQLRRQILLLENRLEPQQEIAEQYLYADMKESFIPARVVDMTTTRPHNHITINKGLRDGVQVGQGVISQSGVVGIVNVVNEQFAQVIPIIHNQSGISCRLKRSSDIGFTQWEGIQSQYVQLMDMPRHIVVEVGDTVVTSGLTGIFREGIMVGIVESATLSDNDSYYSIKVRLATDFRKLRYVQVVANPAIEEMKSLNNM